MNNKRKLHIILAVFMLLIMFFCMFVVCESFLSLMTIADKITFSGKIVIGFFAFPLVSYALIFSIYFNLTDRIPKYHDVYMKYFCMIAIVAVFLSFPVSFYVDYKLKSDSYLVCERISWISDNIYVKDIKLCN